MRIISQLGFDRTVVAVIERASLNWSAKSPNRLEKEVQRGSRDDTPVLSEQDSSTP